MRKEPFNDATKHLSSIEGFPTNKANLKQLPKPIRFIGYFFISFFTIAIVTILLLMLIDKF